MSMERHATEGDAGCLADSGSSGGHVTIARMTDHYAMHVRFRAQAGQGPALAEILLEAAAGMTDVSDCLLYVVSRDADDADTVFVTEAWTSREVHDASLEDEATRSLIGRAMPLLDGRPDAATLVALGGKGL
jgi:quinol monooxygenase YgiN